MFVDLETYRPNNSDKEWNLPSWGHPISQGVMPIFLTVEDHYIPVGTAFLISNTIPFILTATHNITEAIKKEHKFKHLAGHHLDGEFTLKEVGLSVLHQQSNGRNGIRFTFWPIETFQGPSPSDVILGSLKIGGAHETIAGPLCFNLPTIGMKLWSVGYSDFNYPKNGIPISSVLDGSFDWQNEYSHRLSVVEGCVERIFSRQFTNSFMKGPCFLFDAEIRHGMSGGPMLSDTGVVHGINSAGASFFFSEPKSLASLLHQLLPINIKAGIQMGPIRLHAKHRVLDVVLNGTIKSDGSEQQIGLSEDSSTGKLIVHPRFPSADKKFIHDDFQAFQENRPLATQTEPVYRIRRTDKSK